MVTTQQNYLTAEFKPLQTVVVKEFHMYICGPFKMQKEKLKTQLYFYG